MILKPSGRDQYQSIEKPNDHHRIRFKKGVSLARPISSNITLQVLTNFNTQLFLIVPGDKDIYKSEHLL